MTSVTHEIQLMRQLDSAECAEDPIAFIGRHATIESNLGEVMPFELWEFQHQTLQLVIDHDAVIVLKARQLGLTWLAISYALWLAIFHQGSRVLIMCKTVEDAGELLHRLRRQFNRIKESPASAHIAQEFDPRRDAATTFDIGQSVIRAVAANERSARLETASLVILDEFAYAQEAKGIWQAVLPTVDNGGKLWVISTGNRREGRGRQFYKLWRDARKGINGLTPIFHDWRVHPERDQDWYADKERMMSDPDQMRIEFPSVEDDAFIGTSDNAVYSLQALDAAFKLGAQFDQLRQDGQLPPPAGGALQVGIDWGLVKTHALTVWPLPGGGVYIPPGEVVVARGEPTETARQILEAVAAYDFPCDEARYDAAGGYVMKTFESIAPADMGFFGVSFNKRKDRTIAYLRTLLTRTLMHEDLGVIAISPQNEVLAAQLQELKQKMDGKIEKVNDHGPDALIAGVAPIALDYDAELVAE